VGGGPPPQRDGTTVLLTTQYLEEADQLAGRIAIIDHGRIVREGDPKVLKARSARPRCSWRFPGIARTTPRRSCSPFGDLRPAPRAPSASASWPGVGHRRGAPALDESGIAVQHMELQRPSLDDVFAEATGYRLEGAGAPAEGTGEDAAPAPAGRRKGRAKRGGR
jgi:ABC-2 type transport system ATP-binding protein